MGILLLAVLALVLRKLGILVLLQKLLPLIGNLSTAAAAASACATGCLRLCATTHTPAVGLVRVLRLLMERRTAPPHHSGPACH